MDHERLQQEIENSETFEEIKLEITEPHDDKNFMICFENDNLQTCLLYNDAIHTILENNNLEHFHQIMGDQDETGYHGWEIWEKTTLETLQNLLPEIQNEAKTEYEKMKRMFKPTKS